MPLYFVYTMVQKSQKWPETQIKGGGSCLNWPEKVLIWVSYVWDWKHRVHFEWADLSRLELLIRKVEMHLTKVDQKNWVLAACVRLNNVNFGVIVCLLVLQDGKGRSVPVLVAVSVPGFHLIRLANSVCHTIILWATFLCNSKLLYGQRTRFEVDYCGIASAQTARNKGFVMSDSTGVI